MDRAATPRPAEEPRTGRTQAVGGFIFMQMISFFGIVDLGMLTKIRPKFERFGGQHVHEGRQA